MIFFLRKYIAGCTAQCPFCKAQCELTNGDHPTSKKCPKNVQEVNHSTEHRPECLGGFRWKEDNTDTCTFLVASDATFCNNDTPSGIPIRKYIQIGAFLLTNHSNRHSFGHWSLFNTD